MTTETSKRVPSDASLYFLAIAFGITAMAGNLLLMAAMIACLAAVTMRRPGKRGVSIVILALAVAYFLGVFGYRIGKDMAKRDNAVSAASMSDKGAAPPK